MTNAPRARYRHHLSVVVTAWTGVDELERCLTSLSSQLDPDLDEVIVACNFDLAAGHALGSAVAIDPPPARSATVPQLRAAGLLASDGAVVAFIEDHCVAAPGWRDALMRAHSGLFDVVGGPVGLARGGRPLDWAVYFYDYGRFAPPMISGPVDSLSGTNMSFARWFLDDAEERWYREVHETALRDEVRHQRLTMYLDAGAVVIHGARRPARHAVPLAFHLARGFAGRRVSQASRLRRAGFAATTPLLPFLLGSRIVIAVVRRRRELGRLAAALPWLAVLLAAWSAGECAGYLWGVGD
ncbi:MAG: glycosyltransferase family 2 protein, partial [Gemmatimonadales bacterium]